MPAKFLAVVVDGTVAAYPAAAQVECEGGAGADFRPKNWSLALDGAAGVRIEYSFDGVTTHGFLEAGVITLRTRSLRQTQCWFKRTAGAGATRILVEVDQGE